MRVTPDVLHRQDQQRRALQGHQLHVSRVRGGQCLLRLSLGPVENTGKILQGWVRRMPLVSKGLDIGCAGQGPFQRPPMEPSGHQKHAPWLAVRHNFDPPRGPFPTQTRSSVYPWQPRCRGRPCGKQRVSKTWPTVSWVSSMCTCPYFTARAARPSAGGKRKF